MLVDSCYFKASFEDRKWPWQTGYVSWKIAQQEQGGHSHEELKFLHAVLKSWVLNASLIRKQAVLSHPILSEALDKGYDVCASSSGRDGGVRFKFAKEVLKHEDRWDVLDTTDDMEKAYVMLGFFIEEDGKDYDFAGVSGFKVSFIRQNPDKWYCSEICDAAKKLAGLWMEFYRSHPSASYWIQKFLTALKIK